ncbi:hypothetical protein F5Y00DRAFT_263434 [Daldinia vernicosa]|uniref:uncharacterized protein n=1 Tax=Daldinia vernicosa TaxID=114800 RepID=UPI0020089BA2|nr:uncharacterized protein F5Y00DRAFT_263434 [Daldinia vernicosa]KAI0847524.1 hypothetical protein F5Y00DRAFT_263434 [Daldinia vernicosa]
MQSEHCIIPRLLTLCVQQVDFSRLPLGSDMEIASELLEIGMVHRLHVWRHYGYITFPGGHHESWIGRIREMKLVTCIDAETLCRVFESAAKLEIFSLIVPKAHGLVHPPPAAGRDLNYALVKVAGTLKVLELRTCQNRWFLDQLGPSHLLHCLPLLEKLETLTAEVSLFFRIQRNTLNARGFVLFPPNLISLHAAEVWLSPEMFTRRELGMRAFSKIIVAYLHFGLLPNLKHIRYIPDVVESLLDPDELYALKQMFDATRVSFSSKADSLPRQFFYPPERQI